MELFQLESEYNMIEQIMIEKNRILYSQTCI